MHMIHTLGHALNPAATGCRCDMAQITHCVVCERQLKAERTHVDTCGDACFTKLRRWQQRQQQSPQETP